MARPQQFSAVWTIYDGVHEWEELQFCLRYLRPGDHFVDVGANVGVFSTLVGTRIPGVRITAVEPFPPVREDLLANLALNDLEITVVDSARQRRGGRGHVRGARPRRAQPPRARRAAGTTGITVPGHHARRARGRRSAGADQDRRGGIGAAASCRGRAGC